MTATPLLDALLELSCALAIEGFRDDFEVHVSPRTAAAIEFESSSRCFYRVTADDPPRRGCEFMSPYGGAVTVVSRPRVKVKP